MRCWAWRATPKTPSEPLLAKHPQSSCSQGAKASGCCSLWHSAVLAVHVWGIWAPGECSSHQFLPPPLLPSWGDGAHDALVIPAPWQCQQPSSACTTAHSGSGLQCHSESQMSMCQRRGGSSTGEDPRHCMFPFWPKLPPRRGRVLGVGAATFPPRPGRPRVRCCGLPTWSAPEVGGWGGSAAGPRSRATSNLDLESKKAAPAKLPWQQPVNVFLAAGRPPGMEQLHQEAQLNLQSLLQEEYEEQYTESRVTGQTFRAAGHLPPDTSPEPSPRPPPAKRLEFVLMPPSQRTAEEETTSSTVLSARPPDTSLSLPTSPDKQPPWPRAFPLPPVEEKQWHQPSSIQTNIVPINVSETAMNPKSTLRRRRTIIGFPNLSLRDQGSANGPTSSTHTPIGESLSCSFVPETTSRGTTLQEISPRPPLSAPLRKTFSDLGARCCQPPAAMDGATNSCASACNGTQGTPFSPPSTPLSYGSPANLTPGPGKGPTCTSPGGFVPSPSPGSPAASTSFFSATEECMGSNGPSFFSGPVPASPPSSGCIQGAKGNFLPGSGEELEPAAGPAQLEVERAGCRFRERSLSVPTDSGSLCSVDIAYAETRRGSANYALGYPSASSEGSTSTDNISLGLEPEGQRRRRSKSISLKKAKKKPSPPTRSVSLIKEGQDGDVGLSAALPKDQRPKSLCIPPELQGHRLVHTDPQGSAGREPNSAAAPHQWHLTDWRAGSDPYQSLSGSSTTTGTTAVECAKTRGSSESLMSPSVSRATTPSQLSAEADLKTSSPGRPTGLMSPSSGYSSQSETPTPTVPTSTILGHSPHQVRVRPLVPERKSSLPPTSPMERSPKGRLSFDLPLTPPAHLDLSGLKISLKGKTKVSRHHSDSTFGSKLAQKTSPITPIMPVVTQSDLRSVRLRSISRSEPEDNADGPEHTEEPAHVPCPGPERKVKPPVAEKPPLARRPLCILPKPPVLQEEGPLSSKSPPGTTAKEKGLAHDAFVVLRRGELRRGLGEPHLSLTPAGPRRLSQGSLDELRPERSGAEVERRKAKVPPPVPKKPSVLYLPLIPAPAQLGAGVRDLPPTPSPIITLDTDPTCCDPDAEDPPSPKAVGTTPASKPDSEQGSSAEAGTEEKNFASDKTAESIVEEDDEVFTTSRTTEDLFTVIHRSKRKVLGRKEPGDTFSSRPTSHSPVKTSGSPAGESLAAASSSGKSSSRNEDFKALLQKKSSKTSPGTRPSAAELLKTTNPLARRVITEFAPELDGANSPKSQP
ncbi:NHS-like protein 2 isoform X2 [Onychostruthus taczanowskii]|uniref:NHS-like protein 2 isoform X2 n=1 Tax=Onychostruthus taczanowskii TaxID=356909 RepID=UPI001B80C2F5|nr:NHS-like protein 2 isoform X2 [Onychostruthus taczanowskii]